MGPPRPFCSGTSGLSLAADMDWSQTPLAVLASKNGISHLNQHLPVRPGRMLTFQQYAPKSECSVVLRFAPDSLKVLDTVESFNLDHISSNHDPDRSTPRRLDLGSRALRLPRTVSRQTTPRRFPMSKYDEFDSLVCIVLQGLHMHY